MSESEGPETGTSEAIEAVPEAGPEGPTAEARVEELSRALADVINDREAFKRRLERERDRQLESQRFSVATALLEAIDELERALASGAGNPAALEDGVRLIADGLGKRLQAFGLSRIAARGESFDPRLHEAVDLVPVRDREADGVVIDEIRPGWRSGDKVVRPARVRVGRLVAEEPAGREPLQ